MTAIAIADVLPELSRRFSGQLLRSVDAEYDEARRVHNGLIDKRPAVIARCRGVADIGEAIRFARRHGLEIAVRGGGHNVAGRSTVEGGLMIDLSPMRRVVIDPDGRVGVADGGATWADFDRATQEHGLATTGGVVSSTGVGGLTLGGGYGWLQGRHGLSVDNLLAVEIVTAEGHALTASEEENADLFWAVRGGGGNFGVVASFHFRLHPVGPAVVGGLVAHPLENAGEVLRFYREFTASLPDALTVAAGMLHAPDGSGAKLAAVLACHCGPVEEGQAAVQPIKEFGSPAMDAMGPIPYAALNSMLDAGFPKGALNYWKSSFLSGLSDGAIDRMVECFARCPTPLGGIILDHYHGASTQVDERATAFPHRSTGYNMLVAAQWLDPAEVDGSIAWARESYAAMKPFLAAGRYVNYLDRDDSGAQVAAAYGPNYDRLRQVKTKYDPENVFHMNHNIRPRS
ncbi:MAG: FAD-binding oxidoreductase [Gemmatimonadetes bacterium]|nr:FAD-binding oxidoreductase [Gemmatimonadota bacterium]